MPSVVKAKRKALPKDFDQQLAAGDIEALKAVFDSCDLDARGGVFKQTALAFVDCPDELTRWLIKQGADLSAADSYGETPLHARAGHWKGSVDLLLELGADVNHNAGGRGTPLHRAAAVGNLRTAQALLDQGARADLTNQSGQTPLVFALQRCSNATIQQMAPMAELLIGAMWHAPKKSGSLLSRVFGGSAKSASAVTPEMQSLVQRIGTDFEFHRAGFNPESVDATSDALDRLYALFEVPPVPRRAVHDGKSPIIANADRWEDRHQELWEQLVPSSGAAATVQGEVIRISGRVHIEIEDNGAVNWDGEYRKMVDAVLSHLDSGQPLPGAELDIAHQIAAEVKAGRGNPAELCRLAVDWVALNPEPIPLSDPDYRR
jgi:hypothetical protein